MLSCVRRSGRRSSHSRLALTPTLLLPLILLLLGLAPGCATVTGHAAATSTPAAPAKSTPAKPASPTTTTTTKTTPTTSTLAAFTSTVSPVTEAQLGASWHAGCPVSPDQLRLLTMTYWGFDGAPHTGSMVVNASVVSTVLQVFSALFADRFPIQEMVPQSTYGGHDNAAAAADDTSGFNCRDAVAPGPPQWSMHAYGEAIDVNDVQNPYVGVTVIPPAGAAYEDRSDLRPGMAVRGGTLASAFAAVGWQWGGLWTVYPDYQHFSVNGR